MLPGGGSREVIEHGVQRSTVFGPWPALARSWLGRHRRAGLAGATGLAVVIAATAVVVYRLSAPPLPAVTITQRPDPTGPPEPSDGLAQTVPTWPVGPDGRPSGPVVLVSRVALTFRPPTRAGRTEVVGLVGPGIQRTAMAAAVPAGTATTTTSLSTQVDCTRVPLPVPPGSYRLLVRAASGRRRHTAEQSLGADGPRWAAGIQSACATWLARQEVTLTALAARVDPTRPHFDLTLTLTNSGSRDASLDVTAPTASGGLAVKPAVPLPMRIPAGGAATLPLRVDVSGCGMSRADLIAAPPQDPALSQAAAVLGLAVTLRLPVTAAPTARPADQAFSRQPMDADAATTVPVISSSAITALATALRTTCAGTDQVVVLVTPGSVRYQPTARRMTVRVEVYLPPGKAQAVRLLDEPSMADPSSLIPRWSPTRWLHPDPSGLATTNLTYAAPVAGPCPRGGPWMPPMRLQVLIGARTVPFDGLFIDLSNDPGATTQLCRAPPSISPPGPRP